MNINNKLLYTFAVLYPVSAMSLTSNIQNSAIEEFLDQSNEIVEQRVQNLDFSSDAQAKAIEFQNLLREDPEQALQQVQQEYSSAFREILFVCYWVACNYPEQIKEISAIFADGYEELTRMAEAGEIGTDDADAPLEVLYETNFYKQVCNKSKELTIMYLTLSANDKKMLLNKLQNSADHLDNAIMASLIVYYNGDIQTLYSWRNMTAKELKSCGYKLQMMAEFLTSLDDFDSLDSFLESQQHLSA